jgi:FMN reductase
MALKIVGLGGSLAKISRSRAALEIALAGAAAEGAETTLLDVRELDLPMYNPENESTPPANAKLLFETCYAADGMIWSSPMYQGRSPVRSRTHSTGFIRSACGIRRISTTRLSA